MQGKQAVQTSGSAGLGRFGFRMHRVNSVPYLSQQTEPGEGEAGSEYLYSCLGGLALFKARELDAILVPLAVCDGKRRRGRNPPFCRVLGEKSLSD